MDISKYTLKIKKNQLHVAHIVIFKNRQSIEYIILKYFILRDCFKFYADSKYVRDYYFIKTKKII